MAKSTCPEDGWTAIGLGLFAKSLLRLALRPKTNGCEQPSLVVRVENRWIAEPAISWRDKWRR
jgi:hypothetical protein